MTQAAIERSEWECVQPQNPITDEGPYSFRLPPNIYSLDLQRNYIHIVLRIVDGAGNPIRPPTGDNKGVAPINLLAKAFFRNVRLFIGGHLVSDANNMYMYRAFLETELSSNTEAKNTHLQTSLYYTDNAERIDTADNEGWRKRQDLFKDGGWVELVAPLHIDLFHQEKYLINNVDLRLELTRNSDAFLLECFDADPHYRLNLHSMTWNVRKCEVQSSLAIAQEQHLITSPAKYPIKRIQMTALRIDAGRRTAPLNSVFSGQIPRRVIVCMVDSEAYHGHWKKSPWNFKHYNLEQLYITAGGVQFPAVPLKVDFGNKRYMQAFLNLFETLNLNAPNRGNSIDWKSFALNRSIFAFDLSPDASDGSNWQVIKDGNTALNMTFAEQVPAPGIEVLVLGEFDSLLFIDRNRQPSFDYSA
jgi:hypothetical protein